MLQDSVGKLLAEALAELSSLEPTSAEQYLLGEALDNNLVDFSYARDSRNDPATAGEWGTERTVRSSFIEWLATNRRAKNCISQKGIRITGARITGELDLDYAEIPFPLMLWNCALEDEMGLRQAHLRMLSLRGSHAKLISADGAVVDGDLLLDYGFECEEGVSLVGACVGGGLSTAEAELGSDDGPCLDGSRIHVSGDVSICGLRARGEVLLARASIEGMVDCKNSRLENPAGVSLSLDGAQIRGSVFMHDGYRAEGVTRLLGTTIRGQLVCQGGVFVGQDGDSLIATNADIGEDVVMSDGFQAEGRISLGGARIGGSLTFNGGKLRGSGDFALEAPSITVGRSVMMEASFEAYGGINVSGGSIAGQFRFSNCILHSPDGYALKAPYVRVGNGVRLMEGFIAEGEVAFVGAEIRGDFVCSGSELRNEGGFALSLHNASVVGTVSLHEKFEATGEVSLLGTTISSVLSCEECVLTNPDGIALCGEAMDVSSVLLRDGFRADGDVVLAGANIRRWLVLRGNRNEPGVRLDLVGAKAKTLWDSQDSWPSAGRLYLQGFCYDEIAEDATHDIRDRVQWLRLQPTRPFSPQPYEQLAKVFHETGYERAARRIHIAKNVDRRRRGGVPFMIKPLHWLLGVLTGYGYGPWRPLVAALVLITIGWGLFHAGSREAIIMRVGTDRSTLASEEDGRLVYPNFHPLLYSLDIFLPVISFGHSEHWAPNENLTGYLVRGIPISGLALCSYKWFLNVAGWVLTTLFVTTLTGAIRRRLD